MVRLPNLNVKMFMEEGLRAIEGENERLYGPLLVEPLSMDRPNVTFVQGERLLPGRGVGRGEAVQTRHIPGILNRRHA